MGIVETVTFTSAGFGMVAREHLRHLPDATETDIAVWQEGVETGRLQLWAVMHGDARIGTLIWEVENDYDGTSAIVVQALYARPVRGVDVFAQVDRIMTDFAKLTGVTTLRFWTIREGLKRKSERAGYKARYVMERALS